MKIYYSPYSLVPSVVLNIQSSGKVREGVLLKVDWSEGRIGYADLHPWPELGDLPLEQQLADLRNGKMSTQLEQSIWLASRDADLREQKKNIFDTSMKVRNNYIITNYQNVHDGDFDRLKAEGFSCIKFKVGRDLSAEAELLNRATAKDFTLRLDFNGIGSWQIFERFISGLNKLTLSRIDYVEDPFPYDEIAWSEARSLVRIALDNQHDKVNWGKFKVLPFDAMIIKPAKMDVERAVALCKQHRLSATVTSYMDHPVGMMHALAVAMELKKAHPLMMSDPGCFTHHLYKVNVFSAQILNQGPFILRVPGTGIGFDALLEGTIWQLLPTT